ncbi:MAG: hypothetical protein GY820_10655, partial [Gammaproteobacteria bacterium]|nr:hypothetical protein [Gammaproteobacteria bacterium]
MPLPREGGRGEGRKGGGEREEGDRCGWRSMDGQLERGGDKPSSSTHSGRISN